MAIAIALPVVAVALPPVVTSPDAATVPVTVRVLPSNVKLPLSSNSPEAPAITTRLSVRSLTFAELTTKPPAILTPPLASIAPVNVERPVIVAFLLTFKSVCAVTTPTESTLVTSS